MGRGARRKLIWATQQHQIVALPATQNSITDMMSVLSPVALGLTVIRTHITFVFPFVAATDRFTIGLIIGRSDDVGVGVNRPPDALNDPELDWMLNTKIYATASGAAVDTARQVTFDLRSKRKMEELGQRYLLCVQNGSAAAATVSAYARTLVALP